MKRVVSYVVYSKEPEFSTKFIKYPAEVISKVNNDPTFIKCIFPSNETILGSFTDFHRII